MRVGIRNSRYLQYKLYTFQYPSKPSGVIETRDIPVNEIKNLINLQTDKSN